MNEGGVSSLARRVKPLPLGTAHNGSVMGYTRPDRG